MRPEEDPLHVTHVTALGQYSVGDIDPGAFFPAPNDSLVIALPYDVEVIAIDPLLPLDLQALRSFIMRTRF